MTTNSADPLGFGLSCTFCTVVLPWPDGSRRAVTTIQFPFSTGTSPATGKLLPSVTSGRPLLAEAIIRRISTARGTLIDTKIPTTVGNYGIDIQDTVDADMTPEDIGQLSASIDAQIRQEERVIRSTTAAVLAGDVLLVPIQLVDGAGPFRLTLSVSTLNGNLQVLSTPT